MTSADEIRLLRKQLLQARAVLFRLQLQRDLIQLRNNAGAARIAGAALRSVPFRLALLAVVLACIPVSRLSGGARLLARTFQFAGIAARGVALWKLANQRSIYVRQRTDRMVIDA
jgi:hypothetical protein